MTGRDELLLHFAALAQALHAKGATTEVGVALEPSHMLWWASAAGTHGAPIWGFYISDKSWDRSTGRILHAVTAVHDNLLLQASYQLAKLVEDLGLAIAAARKNDEEMRRAVNSIKAAMNIVDSWRDQ